jgi:hypothetical protein
MMSVRINGLASMHGIFKYTKLKETRRFLDALPCINYGGCGISAYAMYLWLKKENQLPEDFKFIFLHYPSSKKSFLNNKRVLEEGNGQVIAPEHVAIKYNGKILDSSGTVDIDIFSLFFEIPLEKAEDYLINSLNTNDWNSMFDRPNIIPIIEKELGISFRADLRRKNKS